MDFNVNVQDLITNISFTEETLAQALLDQPKFFLDASRYRIAKMKTRMQAESRLNQIQTETAVKVRAGAQDRKITEKHIQEQVARNANVKAAQVKYDEAKLLEEWAKLLLDSFRERGSMAKALISLIGAEAAVETGFVKSELERMGVSKLRDKVRSRFPNS